MSRRIISVDVDGIFADFYGDVCVRFNREVEPVTEFYVPWIGEVYESVANIHSFWSEMSTLIEPNEIEFEYDYYISTLRPTMRGARQEWLDNNGYVPRPLHLSDDKHIVCEELGVHIHIDDKLETVMNIIEHCTNTTPILHLPHYLQYENIPEGIIVTRSVAELNEAVRRLCA